jgi:N-methylhydantoinase A
VAQELQIRKVVIPPAAGVFSAVGLLCADLEAVRSMAFLRALNAESVVAALEQLSALEGHARAELGGDSQKVTLRRRAELRYAGQGFELPVEMGRDGVDPQVVREKFEQEYERTYGHCLTRHAIEFVALRVIASVPAARQGGLRRARRGVRQGSQGAGTSDKRQAYFGHEHGVCETPVIDRHELGGTGRTGPLIIEEYEGTTVVPPGARATLDARDNIVIELGAVDAH